MADAMLTRLQEERLTLVKESRDILELAETEDRELTQEETNRWDALMRDVATKDETIARRMKQGEKEKALAQSAGTVAAREAEPQETRNAQSAAVVAATGRVGLPRGA